MPIALLYWNTDVKKFYYIVEGEPKSREQLTDSELATRLSYFLWSSMPDEKLLDASQNGGLHDEALAVEVDRILGAEKINRFVEDFARQWLQLHRVGMFPPDKKLYPKYDAWLEASLRREPVEYFREVLLKNLSVDSFVESDWTVANAGYASSMVFRSQHRKVFNVCKFDQKIIVVVC